MDVLITILVIAVPLGLIFLFFGREAHVAKRDYATLLRLEGDPKIECPHCHKSGCVTTTKVNEKTGIDGGKATAAILTEGVSLLATGLSNQRVKTEATCSHCHSVWRF
jgi:hypothetical protein